MRSVLWRLRVTLSLSTASFSLGAGSDMLFRHHVAVASLAIIAFLVLLSAVSWLCR